MALFLHRLRRVLPRSATLLRRHLPLPPLLHPLISPPPLTSSKPTSISLSSISRSFCTSHFESSDNNHWLIIIDFPQDHKPTSEELVKLYEETAANIFGSLEEAKQKIYACSTTDYIGFQVECSEEISAKFKDLPEVLLVLPDSYVDPVKKEYGGDMYINGDVVSKPLFPGYLLLGSQYVSEDDPKAPVEGENTEVENRYLWPETDEQNVNTPSLAQWNPSLPQQNYGPPHSPQQPYGSYVLNFSTPPPAQSNMEWANSSPPVTPQQNFSTPLPSQWSHSPPPQQNFGASSPQQNYGPPHPPQPQYGPPQQNFSMPHPAQPNMEGVYANCSPNVTPQQNFNTTYQAQWNPSPPRLQQSFGPSPPQQNYGPPHPPQQQYGHPQQNFGMPPPSQQYTSYSPHVTPQQNFSTPSPAQWSPSPPYQNYGPPHPPQQQYGPPQQNFNTPSPAQWSPSSHLQQNFSQSPPHPNYGPPHPPQQQYGAQSNFPHHQNYVPSPHNFGPPPQQSYCQPGLGDYELPCHPIVLHEDWIILRAEKRSHHPLKSNS